MRLVPLFFVAMAWTLGPISPPPPAPAVPVRMTAATETIDTEALHAEARAALERLQQAGARRMVTASAAVF